MFDEKFRKEVKELISKHEIDKEGQILIFYVGDDGSAGFTGYGCPACVAKVIFEACEEGRVVHNGNQEDINHATKH